jgi:hypothetical protein
MATASNLYTEKIYSEHPIATWHLDDEAYYISLINDNQRNFNSINPWTASANTIIYDPELDGNISAISPLPYNLSEAGLSYCRLADATNSETITSSNLEYFVNFNQELATFTIGSWVYTTSGLLEKISIGYTYDGLATPVYSEFITSTKDQWFFISGTFDIPIGITETDRLKVIIKIDADNSSIDEMDYEFYFQGVTVGQLCEEYHAESLGKTKSLLPSLINLSVDGVVNADAYGISDINGYYIVENNYLVSKDGAIPLTYGSSGSIELIPHEEIVADRAWSYVDDEVWSYWDDGTWQNVSEFQDQADLIINAKPSMIFPGFGFLNESGRNQSYTVEFWISLDSNATSPKRIFGPINSTDGLYVENGLLTLVIGNNFVSHYVGEWFRPMLVHIRLIKDQASLLVNGEEVGQLSFNTKTISLPSELTEENKSNDWLGFYAYKNNVVDPILLGSFSIFSYAISTLVAKAHYVYGQGVPNSSEIIDSYYGGSAVEIDYSVSKYNNNKSYPLNLSWTQADIDNLIASDNVLKTPEYSLPTFNLGDKTFSDLENDSSAIQDDGELFFSLSPNSTWDSVNSSIYFNNFSFIPSTVNALYGVFEFTDSLTDQTLMILFKDNNNYLKIRRLAGNSNVNYVFCYNGTTTNIGSVSVPLHEFVAGINIDKLLSNTTIFGLSEFFSNRSLLKMYVGNDIDNKKFTGRIYAFGISTVKNSLEIDHHFSSNGLALVNAYSSLTPHIASYTLLPFKEYGKFYIDISVAGYWRDYIPLSSLTAQVYDVNNNLIEDLDFIQFNIDYPAISDSALTGQTYWTNSSLSNVYNTDNSAIRSYVAFDYTSNGVAKSDEEYSDIPANYSKILDLNNTVWADKRFEVLDNYLIYPDKNVNISNISLICFINFKVKSILKKKAFLRKLEFASKSLNYNSNNPIGTKYGTDVYPFKKVGFYNDYKGKNPILIDKENMPYLYLTRKSGLELRNGTNDIERGVSIPISSTGTNLYSLSAIQMFTRCDLYAFPQDPVKIFEIDYKDDILDFYIKSNSSTGKRGVVFAKLRSTGSNFTGLGYYLNGKIVREPVINIQQWYSLGISFNNALNFNNYAGKLNLKYLMMFNNISMYQGTSLQVVQRIILRSWNEVEDGNDWSYWSNAGDWNNVYIKSRDSRYIVNPSEVYKSYIGTNKIIIDDESDDLNIVSDSIRAYTAASWQTYVISPA